MSSAATLPLSVLIPTFGRDVVLTDTITQLLAQHPRAAEVIVVDQTPVHEAATEARLKQWHESGGIRWIRRETPSQPGALNEGLLLATQPFALMLDDDIRIEAGFLEAHVNGFDSEQTWAVVGQVLQPGETPLSGHRQGETQSALADLDFPFRSDSEAFVKNGMSGNMTVRVSRALQLGCFDENFLPPVSYRFDTDFCKRIVRAGGRIRFLPKARIHHLRAERGGTRSQGSHLSSPSPIHGMGDYYFAMKQGLEPATIWYMVRRPFREVSTRFHLRRPWWIPVKLLGEARAVVQAVRLRLRGPALCFKPLGHAEDSGA